MEQYDFVKTLIEKEACPKSSKGIVVGLCDDNISCNVEIWDSKNYPIAVIRYLFNELEYLEQEDND